MIVACFAVLIGQAMALFGDIDLNGFTAGTVGSTIIGGTLYRLGFNGGYAGDVNGDGIDDIIVASIQSLDVLIVFGRSGGFSVDATTFTSGASDGFKVVATATGYLICASTAGDINNDGYDDIVIGAPTGSPFSRTNAGTIYLIFGHGGAFADIGADTFTAGDTTGFRMYGTVVSQKLGARVGPAGDVNGDGYDDFIAGSTGSTACIMFGHRSGFADIDLTSLVSTGDSRGFLITGLTAWNLMQAANSVGDFNHDGYSDYVFSFPNGVGTNGVDSGFVYVIFGHSNATAFPLLDLSTFTSGTAGFIIMGAAAGDKLAYRAGCAGDFNDDGVDDMIIGAQNTPVGSRTTAGIAYVFFGDRFTTTFSTLDLATFTSGPKGFSILGGVTADALGSSVGFAGDLNNDGIDDLAVGARNADPLSRASAGIVYVIYGRRNTTGAYVDIDLASFTSGTVGFQIFGGVLVDSLGEQWVGYTGDVNADGFNDLYVAAFAADPLTRNNAGMAYIIYGVAPPPSPAPTIKPTKVPTCLPTSQPSRQPTRQPSSQPTGRPSSQPVAHPSTQPTAQPSSQPNRQPTSAPSSQPSGLPSLQPSVRPSTQPTAQLSSQPSQQPAMLPSSQPSGQPSQQPSARPSTQSTAQPSSQPSHQPAMLPSTQPSRQPSSQPSQQPAMLPSSQPTAQPSNQPSLQPTMIPTLQPSGQPSEQPSVCPSTQPTTQPSSQPRRQPTPVPTSQPTMQPTTRPSSRPSSQPLGLPSSQPSSQPSVNAALFSKVLSSPSYQVHNGFGFAVTTVSGTVHTWGEAATGGDSFSVHHLLAGNVTRIVSARFSFAALKVDGSVVPWGEADAIREHGGDPVNNCSLKSLVANEGAFAGIDSATGKVCAFGSNDLGGDLLHGFRCRGCTQALSSGVTSIAASAGSFAVLKTDGTVFAWGHPHTGADVTTEFIMGARLVVATRTAFAVLLRSGSVVAWGDKYEGGDTSAVADQLASGAMHITAAKSVFVAFKTDSSIVVWGYGPWGGDTSAVAAELSANVTFVAHTFLAFVALKSDGSVTTWGDANCGGDSSAVQAQLVDVMTITGNSKAFAARTSAGKVVAWGKAAYGGQIPSNKLSVLSSGVISIYHTYRAFAALKTGGTVVVWGQAGHGGSPGAAVEAHLVSGVHTICSNDVAFSVIKTDGSVVGWGHPVSIPSAGVLFAFDALSYPVVCA